MTIDKLIRLADELKPNRLSRELKIQYINEIEGKLQTDVMLIAPADVLVYTEESGDAELLAKPPYDKVYLAYLVSAIDFALGEYNKYANTIEKLNDYLNEYKAWYARTYHPIDGNCIAEGYYLSAYGMAVSFGFKGSAEEWLDTLKGEPGRDGEGRTSEFRYSEQVLEWKYTDEDEDAWRALIDIGGIGISIEEAKTSASQAADSASEARTAAGQAEAAAAAAAKSASEAAGASGGGVSSFKGRSGAVNPQAGDYTADMVGADASGAASAAVLAHNGANDAHPGKFAEAGHTHQASEIQGLATWLDANGYAGGGGGVSGTYSGDYSGTLAVAVDTIDGIGSTVVNDNPRVIDIGGTFGTLEIVNNGILHTLSTGDSVYAYLYGAPGCTSYFESASWSDAVPLITFTGSEIRVYCALEFRHGDITADEYHYNNLPYASQSTSSSRVQTFNAPGMTYAWRAY